MKNVAQHLSQTNLFRGILGALLLLFMFFPKVSLAVTPAGTVIGNQAVATYSDSGGNSFTTQSNIFSITVSQVAGVSLTPAAQSFSGVPGNAVQFPHVITNTGNGTDTFNLTPATGGTVTLTSVEIFRDDNGDGLASAGEPVITAMTLAMNASQNLVVRGVIPASALSSQSGTITLTATSAFDITKTIASVDTANVVSTAVISLSKVVSASSVNPGGTLDYTINYTNTGIASTGGVSVILDTIPTTRHVVRDILPANTTFDQFLVPATPSGGVTAYHETGAAEDTYVALKPASFDAVAYLFPGNMIGGQSGTFSFKVNVATTTPVSTISNSAIMKFNNGSVDTSQTSNTVSTSVNLVPGVILRDTDSPLDDIQVVASGNAGSSVTFTNEVKNTGNGDDRFNITVSGGNFPAGTVFALFKGDGVTPLLDSNSDGTPDTGLLAANATSSVLLKATLPANATNTGSSFNATVTAISVANSATSNTVTDQLSTIVPAGVDVVDHSGLLGTGAGPESSPVVTASGNPGTTVNIDLHVKNTGPSVDNFDLQFSNSGSSFVPGTLPTGITAITFFKGNGSGSPTGGPITNTGAVLNNGNQEIIAQVTIASTGVGGTDIELFFKALSPSSSVSDIIHDRLTVNTLRGITLQQNQSNQTSPGGAALYPHILTNAGNVTEPLINLTAGNSASGFVTTIYLDNNGDGLINGADAIISSVTNLGAGSSTSLIIRVATPSSAANGTADTMTFTVTPTGTVNGAAPSAAQVNTDTTTIVTGNIDLTLTGTPSGPQPPGTTITYTISYLNTGAAVANALVITNAMPVNTTYVSSSMTLGATPLTDVGGDDAGTLIGGTKGSVQFTLGTVSAGSSGTVSFKVTID